MQEAARRKAEEASENIANSIDPSEIRKQGKQNTQIDTENAKRKADGLPILNSLEHAARDWCIYRTPNQRNHTYQKNEPT